MVGRYVRTPIREESKEERDRGFGEVLEPFTQEEAVIEAQRCLQCAMPFCVQACPITQDCRGYIDLIAHRKFDEAAHLTVRDNPLATVLCKTCYHYCEEDCVMGERGNPIAIRHLKRAALEFGKADLPYVPSKSTLPERIAVVGGGPSGLMAAWELALRGYSVVVYEEHKFLGGQMDTIPKYHLQGYEQEKDLARFRNLGIRFEFGQKAGTDFTPEGLLQKGFAAVLLAVGAWDPRTLGIEGEHLPGVFYALSFLLAMNTGDTGLLGRKGRKVLVIGGGDVAMDAARSSLRLSSEGNVALAYRRGEKEMPAGEEELRDAEIEGLQFLYNRAPVRILGTEQVEGVVLQRTELGPPDANGRRGVVTVAGSEETFPCDTVIIAAGERAEVKEMPKELGLKVTPHGWAEGAREDWMTDVPGVFACGGRSVVYAMGAGTRAAGAIDAYLSTRAGRPPTVRPDPLGAPSPAPLPSGYGGPSWRL